MMLLPVLRMFSVLCLALSLFDTNLVDIDALPTILLNNIHTYTSAQFRQILLRPMQQGSSTCRAPFEGTEC